MGGVEGLGTDPRNGQPLAGLRKERGLHFQRSILNFCEGYWGGKGKLNSSIVAST